jgi:hypothetical protein
MVGHADWLIPYTEEDPPVSAPASHGRGFAGALET